MADIIITDISELKNVIVENLKEGIVISFNLSGKENDEDV